jgi:hypothetical protein
MGPGGLTAVFKHVVDNLHDTRAVLNNCDFGTLVHLQCSVEKTVNRNSSIAVNAIKC